MKTKGRAMPTGIPLDGKVWPRNTAPMHAAYAAKVRLNRANKAVAMLISLGYEVTLTKVDPTAPDVDDATMN
jgi:hypothetical protein